jgi:hypothetical protein
VWKDEIILEKKDDLGRPVILISIGQNIFEEAVCDHGASINIMPKIIYEKFLGDTLLYTTICLQLADQLLCYPKGILEDIYARVGNSYVLVDFMVVEIGGYERPPIILGRPILNTAKAIIYTSDAKICFTIGDRKEKFSFKNKTLKTPAHSQMAYTYEDKTGDKKKMKNKSKNKPKQP